MRFAKISALKVFFYVFPDLVVYLQEIQQLHSKLERERRRTETLYSIALQVTFIQGRFQDFFQGVAEISSGGAKISQGVAKKI